MVYGRCIDEIEMCAHIECTETHTHNFCVFVFVFTRLWKLHSSIVKCEHDFHACTDFLFLSVVSAVPMLPMKWIRRWWELVGCHQMQTNLPDRRFVWAQHRKNIAFQSHRTLHISTGIGWASQRLNFTRKWYENLCKALKSYSANLHFATKWNELEETITHNFKFASSDSLAEPKLHSTVQSKHAHPRAHNMWIFARHIFIVPVQKLAFHAI